MSDTGRQSMTDKAAATAKPDSEKSTTEKIGEKAKGMTDSAASAMQPESEKSHTQKLSDKASGDSNQESLGDKAKHAMGFGQQGKD